MDDLAVIIVSTSEAHWIERCLPTVFAHAGDLALDVVVVDNESRDHTRRLVEEEFPQARVVPSANHGFGHANNRGLMTCDARWVLFLNPDTEVLEGTLEDLVRRADAVPELGIAGGKQATPEGQLFPTMRRFPNARRAFMEAIGCEKLPGLRHLGNRELRMDRYEREFDLDWTSGSFMLVRREALESAGWWDERFFMYGDESDLALRVREAGWTVRHMPYMRILHHTNKMGFSARGYAQMAFAARIYARKHFSPVHRGMYLAAMWLRYGSRLVGYRVTRRGQPDAPAAMRRALASLAGGEPPYQPVPPTAVRPRADAAVVADPAGAAADRG